MKTNQLKLRFAALLTLAAVSTGLGAQSAQAADRKVMMENFEAIW